jgi:tetratricopeptide (TPR) repeat protein
MKSFKIILFACSATALVSCGDKTETGDQNNQNNNSSSTELSELNDQIQDEPNNAELYHLRAEYYITAGQIEPAIRDAEKAATLDSLNAANHIFLGQLYEKRPYMQGAIAAYEKAVKLNPKNKDSYLKLGILYFQVRDRENSFKNLNKSIALDDNNPEAFFYRGYNYRELNDMDRAIENFQVARNLKQDYVDAYLQLGLIYATKNDKRARDYYTTALRLDPGNLRALYARGIYYQEADSSDLAIKDYETILELVPEFLSTNLNIGYIYLQRKDYEKAIQYLTQAIENSPSKKEAYEYRSQAYKASGKKDLAAADDVKANELALTPQTE